MLFTRSLTGEAPEKGYIEKGKARECERGERRKEEGREEVYKR